MTNRVSDSEQRVMEVLWQESPLSSTEVVARLEQQDWNEKTVKTFLNRLVKKQAVTFRKEGRRYLYSPAVQRENFLKTESAGFLDKIFGGDMKELLATFVQNKQLSADELDYLQRLLDDEQESPKSKKSKKQAGQRDQTIAPASLSKKAETGGDHE